MRRIRSMIQTTTTPCWEFTPQPLLSFSTARLDANRWVINVLGSLVPPSELSQQFFFSPSIFVFILNVIFCPLIGFSERGSGHPQSYPHYPDGAHCWLLPEDPTAGQMLFTAGWCHGQEWMHAGENISTPCAISIGNAFSASCDCSLAFFVLMSIRWHSPQVKTYSGDAYFNPWIFF